MNTILQLPNFKDGVKLKGYIDVDITDYAVEINSIQDFKDKILSKIEVPSIESYNQLKEDIDKVTNENIIFQTLKENRRQFKERIKFILSDYNESTKQKYEDQINEAIQFIKKVNDKSNNFIIQNSHEIKNEIDGFKQNVINALKENRKVVNKKYYEKRKQELNTPTRQKLTEEQKKENRRIANQKYREAQKQLNEKEINNEIVEEVTATEKKKQYNKTYYQKQKTLKEKIKQLENEIKEFKR